MEKSVRLTKKGQQVRPQVRPMLYFKHIAQFYNKHSTNLSKYIPYGKISQINKKGQQVRPQVHPMLYFKHIPQFYNKHSTI